MRSCFCSPRRTLALQSVRSIRHLGVVLLAACGSDGPSGPNLGAGPAIATLSGAWTMSFGDMTDGSLTCFTDEFTVTLAQDRATFTGDFGTATLTCTNGVNTVSDQMSGQIANGSISTSTISFDLDTPDRHQSGTWTESGISGTARWVLSSTTLTGVWSASRVP